MFQSDEMNNFNWVISEYLVSITHPWQGYSGQIMQLWREAECVIVFNERFMNEIGKRRRVGRRSNS